MIPEKSWKLAFKNRIVNFDPEHSCEKSLVPDMSLRDLKSSKLPNYQLF